MSPDAVPTLEQICADPQRGAQWTDICTVPPDPQAFQHIGMWIIAGGTAFVGILAMVAIVSVISLFFTWIKAAKRSLEAAS